MKKGLVIHNQGCAYFVEDHSAFVTKMFVETSKYIVEYHGLHLSILESHEQIRAQGQRD